MPLSVDDKCLAFHGPLLYAAKVLKVHDPSNGGDDDEEIPPHLKDQQCFYIHYRGWKSSWDEWVGHDRIREYTEENLELKKQLVQETKEASNAKKKAVSKPKKIEAKKKRSAATALQEEALPTGPRITIHISHTLKSILVDDWERITKDKKLIELPCKSTVAEVLNDYYEEASAKEISPVTQSQLKEYCDGIKLYFDCSLSAILLYRFERLQYANEAADGPASSIYGAIHLLRLLSSLPELVSLTAMDERGCDVVVQQTDKLLKWLTERKTLFEESNYINTSSQYEGMALGM
ncbi:Eaf3p [Lachancea thermotolerans CBS 6340]|uniref:Chromatin modification-related protein EAF3 n=1 Tax=Lachancea thermotolerans (strain ATCC 56472 / CBS 6340 / NRRL Y-8284) TaxID=559295 RepID=C5DHT5_LACTC|nr:KLTH0E06974p [Lachancea thermotolerans CBS 6340]CAR23346.1 KLTH0E06974p [Lachancea thermotolerans CBS 6340]